MRGAYRDVTKRDTAGAWHRILRSELPPPASCPFGPRPVPGTGRGRWELRPPAVVASSHVSCLARDVAVRDTPSRCDRAGASHRFLHSDVCLRPSSLRAMSRAWHETWPVETWPVGTRCGLWPCGRSDG